MANDADIQVRRAAIASMIANPYEKTPTKQELAKQFNIDVRTIYRDLESAEVQDKVQSVIRSYAKSEGLAASYKVILSAVAGQGYGKKEQLKAAMWLVEQTKLFEGESPNEDTPAMDILSQILQPNTAMQRENEELKQRIADLEGRMTNLNGGPHEGTT